MSTAAGPISEETVKLFMDYGQFCIDGGLGNPDEEIDLLDRALAAHPFASDGLAMVVLSPHQNNFRMLITVQVWGARPPWDRDEWQQVCEARLRVGPEGSLYLSSPTDGAADCPVPEGEYLIEVSGRGFINYGWPGSTKPGDVWRIRLWPDDGSEPLQAVQWSMPGYGVPEDVPIAERSVSAETEESEWVTVIDEDGPRHLHISEFREQAAAAERQRWGGDPIPELRDCSGAEELSGYDRALAEAIAAMGEQDLRRLARWSAAQACEKASIAERPWVQVALTALQEGRPLPPPFDDMEAASARLHDEDFGPVDEGGTELVASLVRADPRESAPNPFDLGPIHRASFALPTIVDAAEPEARDAAMTTLYATALVFGPEVDVLLAAVRTEFGLPPR
ncbi:hypothetical protein OH799_14400 [Nocardia sp. NBC_00881]|uniref:hypothetical protein n=1 Tax=Nocardia sp. NBC_00881 TaxID=2975995 RepID=UPI00386F7500|nr:hypothetical protein OH799_14400 [Nocardia sp. NBC_00881]